MSEISSDASKESGRSSETSRKLKGGLYENSFVYACGKVICTSLVERICSNSYIKSRDCAGDWVKRGVGGCLIFYRGTPMDRLYIFKGR